METMAKRRTRTTSVDAGDRDGLTTEERKELTRLRREYRLLRLDVEVLKRAKGIPVLQAHPSALRTSSRDAVKGSRRSPSPGRVRRRFSSREPGVRLRARLLDNAIRIRHGDLAVPCSDPVAPPPFLRIHSEPAARRRHRRTPRRAADSAVP